MTGKRSIYTVILISTMILGVLTGTVPSHAQPTHSTTVRPGTTKPTAATAAIKAQLTAQGVNYDRLTPAQRRATYIDVIVELTARPASQRLKPTTASTAQIQAATQRVTRQQRPVQRAVAAITHQGIGQTYGYVLNGFATKAKVGDLHRLSRLAGVARVTVAQTYHRTDASANDMGNVATVHANYRYKGAGTVVAVIDSGLDPHHHDLRLSDPKRVKLTRGDVRAFTQRAGYGKYFTAKVPYGHNYADNNNRIKDTDPTEQHGMHVAGIIGANGTGSDFRHSVTGVAPEAQLLAMKAFSNSSSMPGSDSTSVVAAIEDSAKLGADVLNLSLGSDAGEQTDTDPEVQAVDTAEKTGVAAVIAAGNSGASGSDQRGDNTDKFGNADNTMIGTPGTARSATTVAAAENQRAINTAITIRAGHRPLLGPSTTQVASKVPATAFDHQQFALVQRQGRLLTGRPGDFTAAVRGKIAVVRRGDTGFAVKQALAKAAGARGLLIVNNAGGNTPLINASYRAGFPTAGLSTNDGRRLIGYLRVHPQTRLHVTVGLADLANPSAKTDQLASFTSYGPNSDLTFKPDITAPGGNIWSTQNNNRYTNMSGTSMASPYIAGTQALLTEALNDPTTAFYRQYQALTGSQKTTLIKTLEMNTARPVVDRTHAGAIASPRRQGAGLIDANAAITALRTNPSTVTSATDYPAVELKSFTARTQTLPVTVTNRTTQALTYRLATQDAPFSAVYTSATDAKHRLYDRAITGATMTVAPMTVPAGQRRTLAVTLTLPADFAANQYVEGFLRFSGSDNTTLSLPYMGFFGDWGAGSAIDPLNGQLFDPQKGSTGTIVAGGNNQLTQIGYLGLQRHGQKVSIDSRDIALSPAAGALTNWIKPEFGTFRHLNNAKSQILDAHGTVLRQVDAQRFVPKTFFSPEAGMYSKYYAAKWDGTMTDQTTGKTVMVPDGTYTYRLSGTIDGTTQDQHLDLPVVVDRIAPRVTHLALTRTHGHAALTALASDDRSGLSKTAVTRVNGLAHSTTARVSNQGHGVTRVRVPLTHRQAQALGRGRNNVGLVLYDRAGNPGRLNRQLPATSPRHAEIIIDRGGLPRVIATHTSGYRATRADRTFRFAGTAPAKPHGTYTDPAGRTHRLAITYVAARHDFTAQLPVRRGDYATRLTLISGRQRLTKRLRVSLIPAKLTRLTVNGTPTVTGNRAPRAQTLTGTRATLTGTVSADTHRLTIQNGDQSVPHKVVLHHGRFTQRLTMAYGTTTVRLVTTDADGNRTTITQRLSTSANGRIGSSDRAVQFAGSVNFGLNLVNAKTPHYDRTTGILTVRGHVTRPTTTLKLAGHAVPLTSNGAFTLHLAVGHHGSRPFSLLIGDRHSHRTIQDQLTFYVDTTPPTVTLEGPTTVHTDQPTITLKGTIDDDFPYYALMINDSQVAASNPDIDMNGTQPLHQAFSEPVNLKPGTNHFVIRARDIADNVSARRTVTVIYQAK